MLHLAEPTDPEWIRRALADIDELLVDHAHCEKKAASTAISLLFRYPDVPQLVVPLSRLAREELLHFETVVGCIMERGQTLRRQVPSPYAGQLMKVVSSHEPWRLHDTLLCCAMIEARSCERMRLLADHLADPMLAALYRGLVASEARHHGTYLDLARDIFGAQRTIERVEDIARHEADVIRGAPNWPRMHT